jgi:hypothetical protein
MTEEELTAASHIIRAAQSCEAFSWTGRLDGVTCQAVMGASGLTHPGLLDVAQEMTIPPPAYSLLPSGSLGPRLGALLATAQPGRQATPCPSKIVALPEMRYDKKIQFCLSHHPSGPTHAPTVETGGNEESRIRTVRFRESCHAAAAGRGAPLSEAWQRRPSVSARNASGAAPSYVEGPAGAACHGRGSRGAD